MTIIGQAVRQTLWFALEGGGVVVISDRELALIRDQTVLAFAAEDDETAILDSDGERNYSLENRVQEANQLLNISSRMISDKGPNILSHFSFAAEDETATLGLDRE